MRKELYLISGLGADERIFSRLDFEGYTPRHIHWIAPLPEESVRAYAARLRTQITSERPLLMGVSFGGMIATEIARQIPCEGVILVSTAQTRNEIPWYFRMAGVMRLHRLLPVSLLKNANAITYWFFGMKTPEEELLLRSILADTDSVFLSWALDAILRWDNTEPIANAYRLHGEKDRILPVYNLIEPGIVIKDGGHLMIYSRAHEINAVLWAILRA